MDKPKYEFDDIADLKRNRDLEADGIMVHFPGDRWIKVAAATDANPMWKARREKLLNELGRLRNAKAPEATIRAFLAHAFAELCGRDWGNWRSGGVDLPYSREAFEALLLSADDVYSTIDQVVWDTKNFRGARVEAVVDLGKE